MIRHCDGTDPELGSRAGGGYCPCGLTFDDERYSIMWPHLPLPHGRGPQPEQVVRVLDAYL